MEAFLSPLDTEACALGTDAEGVDGAVPWDHIDVLAATPDGTYLYLINDGGATTDSDGEVIKFNIATGECIADPPQLGGDFVDVDDQNNTDQGAVSSSGLFYIGRNDDETLHTVDADTGLSTQVGTIVNQATCETLDLQGSNWTFDASGNLWLFINQNKANAPRGLYVISKANLEAVDDGSVCMAGDVLAELKGQPIIDGNFTGWATRFNGLGNISGSNTGTDDVLELDTTDFMDGEVVRTFNMVDDIGEFPHMFGDMSNGRLEICNARTVGFYKNRIDGRVDSSLNGETVQLCGVTLDSSDIDEILEDRRGNEYSQLAAQLIAAIWNCDRAEDGEIDGDCNVAGVPTISAAEDFLCTQSDIAPPTLPVDVFTRVDRDDRSEVGDHVEALDDYNDQGHDSLLCAVFAAEEDD